MKIYTKTGDDGQTGLYGGQRLPKTSARIEAIGVVDELNAELGVCRTLADDGALGPEISRIQEWLFDLGAMLANPSGKGKTVGVGALETAELEASMDRQAEALSPLRTFILPGGCMLGARLHVARACCRRAERETLRLAEADSAPGEALVFLNRLSDWLFVAARTANALAHVEDIAWTGNHRSS